MLVTLPPGSNSTCISTTVPWFVDISSICMAQEGNTQFQPLVGRERAK